MNRPLHPLVTVLIGALVGAGVGYIGVSVFGGHNPSTQAIVLWCLAGAGLFAGLFGLMHLTTWAYRSVPEIRGAAATGWAVGLLVGGCLATIGCLASLVETGQPTSPRDARATALLAAMAGGGIGFLIGLGAALVRVRLQRRGHADDPAKPPQSGKDPSS